MCNRIIHTIWLALLQFQPRTAYHCFISLTINWDSNSLLSSIWHPLLFVAYCLCCFETHKDCNKSFISIGTMFSKCLPNCLQCRTLLVGTNMWLDRSSKSIKKFIRCIFWSQIQTQMTHQMALQQENKFYIWKYFPKSLIIIIKFLKYF